VKVLGALLALVVVAQGCSRDPTARSREFEKKADAYAARLQWKEALIEYSNAIKATPDAGLYAKRARAYLAIGDVRSAYAAYGRAADLEPSNVELQLEAGRLLLAANDFEGARVRAERALAINRTSAAAHVLLGNALIGSNEASQALKQIEEALKLDPSSSEAWMAMGATRVKTGLARDAKAAFEKAVALAPSSVEAHLSLANFLWSNGDLVAAERELLRLPELRAEDPIGHRALAAFYLATGRPGQAEPHLKALATDDAGRLALGVYYTQLRRWPDAEAVLRPLTTSSTNDTARAARLQRAIVQFAAGSKADAYRAVDAVITEKPHRIDARLTKTRMLLADGKLEAADTEAAATLTENSGSAEAQFVAGLVASARGDVERAAKSFEETVRINPRAAAAHLQLAKLRLERGEPAAAVTAARRAVALAPEDGEAALLVARGLRANGNPAGAVDYLKAFAETKPASVPMQIELGWAYLQTRRFQEATAAFNEALRVQPGTPAAREGLVAVAVARNRIDEARAMVNRWLQSETPPPAPLRVLAAKVDLAAGRTEAATAALNEVVVAAPDTLEAYALLAQIYAGEGQLDAAIEQYRHLADTPNVAASALTMIGQLEEAGRRTVEARTAYERALQANPRIGVAANNLAWLYAEDGRLDDALRLATDAERLLRNRAEPIDTAGWVYYKKGEFEQAAAKFVAALAREPQRATYHFHLALTRAQQGRCDEAGTSLNRARQFGFRPDGTESFSSCSTVR